MKQKLILGLIILFTLMFNPTNVSKSATINMTQKEMDILSNQLRINVLERKIEEEYSKFYTDLDSIQINDNRVSKRAAKFMGDLVCDAMKSEALPSIVIAQASLETGYGRYMELGNNMFGHKWYAGRWITVKTHEYINNKRKVIRDKFQYYPTKGQAFEMHWDKFLSRYDFKTRDYVEWATKIKDSGYATDPMYSKKLNDIIQKYGLDRLDRIQEMEQRLIELKNFNALA